MRDFILHNMKKLVYKFIKPTKSRNNFYSFCMNDLPQSDNSTLNIISSQTDIYKNFQFDSYHYTNNNDICEKILEQSQVCSEKLAHSKPPANGVVREGNLIKRQSSSHLGGSSVEKDYVGKNNDHQLSKQNGRKFNSSTYVISINNSQNFCIGSQKTVYVNDNIKGVTVDNVFNVEQKNWEPLFNCDKKLTENDIFLISQYVDDHWRDFIQNLGVEESLIENTTIRNNNNKTLIVYDLLMKYLIKYPNTSLGFVAKVLKNTNQYNTISKLSPKIK